MYEMTGKWIWIEESAAMGECPCAVRIYSDSGNSRDEVSRCVCVPVLLPQWWQLM